MFQKPKSWLWKTKNPHSLEHLKVLYGLLGKNQTVTEQNRALLVETLRSISEILIWGDQNDSSVFDFFLEKNMLAFFLRFMRQKYGRFICVQLLQTLNILFDNISNETSVYYLLSNNHINSIIVHKFDFSDEEVMAYYISFLKTLSLKLNKHTIHFFYNEHTNDFALYTEAIKFFNHSESMVRIAVRTITLNVYKVDDKGMLRYIRDKTAAPYFSNLVWYLGNHVLELDTCVRHDTDHNSRGRLSDLVAEHLDHLHYLNDIIGLNIDALNEVLTDHLLNRLLIPLYVLSLRKRKKYSPRSESDPHVSSVVSLFLLSQVFLIMHHAPMVRQLADIIFNGDSSIYGDTTENAASPQPRKKQLRGFRKPEEPLAETLDNARGGGTPMKRPNYTEEDTGSQEDSASVSEASDAVEDNSAQEDTGVPVLEDLPLHSENFDKENSSDVVSPNQNSTDDEKLLSSNVIEGHLNQVEFSLSNRPFLEAVFNALESAENDYETLFSLCLLYALGHNTGINQELLDTIAMPTDKSKGKEHYNVILIEKLIRIISLSCQNGSKIRLATLELSIKLLKTLVQMEERCCLQDRHLAAIEGAREEATLLLRNFYKSEEIFLDMFEDEYREMKSRPLNVEYLTMDASILLPPTGTPLTGIEFNKRLPCGEVERARRAIRVFFYLRDLSLDLRKEPEIQLPLTKQSECVNIDDVLDLNNSDLIACTVITKDKRERRFLVIDVLQLILVEPDTRRLGWGIVKFVGFLQDVEVTGDKDDSRSLHITIHKPSINTHAKPLPLLSARFIFDDHIRCMAAKQRLTKGRLKARQRKMQMIARLLELPRHIIDSMYQPPSGFTPSAVSLRANASGQESSSQPDPLGGNQSSGEQRAIASGSSQSAAPSRRSKTKPVQIRQHPGGAARQVTPAQAAKLKAKAKSKKERRSAQASELFRQDDVEQAEEARPSPEAHAVRNLNVNKSNTSDDKSREGRTSQVPLEPGERDIPLEDMSKKPSGSKAKILKHSMFPASSSALRVRSNSYSPATNRKNSSHSGSKESNVSGLAKQSQVSRLRAEGRDRSDSLPIEVSSGRSRRRSSPSTSGSPGRSPGKTTSVGVTSFIKKDSKELARSHSEGEKPRPLTINIDAQDDSKEDSNGRLRKHSDTAAPSPKTLTPAQTPPASLVACDIPETVAPDNSESPKLLPPAEPNRLRSFSDVSTESIEVSAEAGTSTEGSKEQSKSPLVSSKTAPAVEESTISADLSKVDRVKQEDVTEHLTKLSQSPKQKHFVMGPDSVELEAAAIVSNVTDEIKEQNSTTSSTQS